jgi:Flp pilus assembly protein TadG
MFVHGSSSRSAFCRHLRDFVRDRRGNVALLFGLSIIPLLIAVGLGVDYGRGLLVKERMEDALDAAALALGSWTDLSQSEMQAKAQQFFDANYAGSTSGTEPTVSLSTSGDNITVSVSGEVPTTFMQLAGYDTMNVQAASTVTKKQRNIELALVLDTTGSMAQNGKIQALKSAATDMVNNLFEGQSTSDTVKIAVVPFAAAVNVGASNANASWLDTGGKSSIAQEDFNGVNPWTLYGELQNRSWSGCVRERAAPYDLTDDPPDPSIPDTLFAPYFAPDEPDSMQGSGYGYGYANNYLPDGDTSTTTCTTNGGGGRGRGHGSHETCTTTYMTDPEIQASTAKYNNAYVNSSSNGPNFNCAASSLIPLTETKSTILNAINALTPNGSTALPTGLLWGWRVLSPTPPFTEGAAYDDDKWVKALVLLTDGENDVGGGSNGFNESYYNAFGYADKGHLGSGNGSQAESDLDSKTLTVCDAIKAKGILLYTIGFQVTSHSQSLLQSCATEPDMFYNSPSTADLDGIFSDIAQGLGELRIAQ